VARPRVTVYFSEEVYQYLAERADREVRTVANLVEYLIVQLVQEEKAGSDRQDQRDRERE
jgi:hypothetical protein